MRGADNTGESAGNTGENAGAYPGRPMRIYYFIASEIQSRLG